MAKTGLAVQGKQNAIQLLASRLSVDAGEMKDMLKATAFRDCKTDAEFLAAVIVANTYGLNPLLKEIYAFPSQKGVIPVVPIDGMISLALRNPRFNGVELIENEDPEGKQPGGLFSVTAKFYLKGIDHPVVVTEYMSECYDGNKAPWKKWPRRMLRHKAYIQGGRIAFGLSGVYDEDEAQRIVEAELVSDQKMKPAVAEPQSKSEQAAGAPEPVELTETPLDVLTQVAVGKTVALVLGTVVSASGRQSKKEKRELTDYVVTDNRITLTITVPGTPVFGAGDLLSFKDVYVSGTEDEKTYWSKVAQAEPGA